MPEFALPRQRVARPADTKDQTALAGPSTERAGLIGRTGTDTKIASTSIADINRRGRRQPARDSARAGLDRPGPHVGGRSDRRQTSPTSGGSLRFFDPSRAHPPRSQQFLTDW